MSEDRRDPTVPTRPRLIADRRPLPRPDATDRRRVTRFDGSVMPRLELRAKILDLLAGGPLKKVDIQHRLAINEQLITTELHALKAEGEILVVGTRRLSRRWALRTWQPMPTPLPHLIARQRATEVTSQTSWWTAYADPTLPRQAFTEEAQQHSPLPSRRS